MHSAGGANAPTGSSTHSASGAAPSERAPDKPIEPTAQPSPKPSPKPLLSKPNFEALWSTLRFILILGASFLIFVLLQKLFEKVDPSKVRDEDLSRVLSQDEKAEFRKRLKELDSAKLSAEEEVIRRYHLLLEILASAGHARKDSEPPVLYSRKLSRSIPFLASPIQGASLSFSDVLYGKLPVEGEQLKQYRLRVDQVARQFL
jgi:hypothetical protein